MIFNPDIKLEYLTQSDNHTLIRHLGIEYLEIGPDYLTARMPVDARTHQPYGLLHGGASVVLAETLGSVASVLTLADPIGQGAVGVEINANHLKSARSGWVYGKATPVHLGRKLHVWDIKITNEAHELVCVSRFTAMIIDRKMKG